MGPGSASSTGSSNNRSSPNGTRAAGGVSNGAPCRRARSVIVCERRVDIDPFMFPVSSLGISVTLEQKTRVSAPPAAAHFLILGPGREDGRMKDGVIM